MRADIFRVLLLVVMEGGLRIWMGGAPAPLGWDLGCRVEDGLEMLRIYAGYVDAVSVPEKFEALTRLVIGALYDLGEMRREPRVEVRT